jgi:hypothetical protein
MAERMRYLFKIEAAKGGNDVITSLANVFLSLHFLNGSPEHIDYQ